MDTGSVADVHRREFGGMGLVIGLFSWQRVCSSVVDARTASVSVVAFGPRHWHLSLHLGENLRLIVDDMGGSS